MRTTPLPSAAPSFAFPGPPRMQDIQLTRGCRTATQGLQRRPPIRRSVALVTLEPDEPVETITVDDLPVGCAPRPLLQVVYHLAPFAEAGKPGAQSRGIGSTKQLQHQAFASDWPLIPGHVGAGQRDESPGEIAVGDGIGRTVGPVELREGVQLNCTAKDVTVERQGLTSSTREKDVRRRAGHESTLRMAWPGRALIGVAHGGGRPKRGSPSLPPSRKANRSRS